MVHKRKLEIPRTIVRHIVEEIVDDSARVSKKKRFEKKALNLLHSEAEKYIREIFTISDMMATGSKRRTVTSLEFNNATKIHNYFIHD